ncbi:MAG: DUF1292 domain-containing protein [Lachnospiraceae bacterium]|nr:DUF1292 domain-containing protein [Lachnospiraceae bacterium]
MNQKSEKIAFVLDNGEVAEFYVVEQTRIGGADYILVTDSEEGDADALILKDVSAETDSEGIYEIVENDDELTAVSGVFADMMDDIDLI